MPSLSLSDLFDETRRFVAAEFGLLFPLGLATFGAAALIFALVAPQQAMGPHMAMQMQAAPWMWWLIPIFGLVLVGYLSASLLALRPKLSVAEALAGAVRRLPFAVALLLILVAIATMIVVGASAAGVAVGALAGFGAAQAATLGLMLALPVLAWFGVKITLLWPVLAAGGQGPLDTLRQTLALSKGQFGKLALLLVGNMLLYLLLAAILQMAGGSVLLLVARLAGAVAQGPLLVAVLMAAFNAAYMTAWAVLLARAYVKLAA